MRAAPDTDRAATEAFGEPVLVVPTELAGLVLAPLCRHSRKLIEALLARVGQCRDANRTITRKQIDRGRGAVVEGDCALMMHTTQRRVVQNTLRAGGSVVRAH